MLCWEHASRSRLWPRGYRVFDRITPFDTSAELRKGNVAVGIVVGSIFVGTGIAIGLVIGMGLN